MVIYSTDSHVQMAGEEIKRRFWIEHFIFQDLNPLTFSSRLASQPLRLSSTNSWDRSCKTHYLYEPPLPPWWLLLGSPMLMDPRRSQQHAGLQHAVWRSPKESTMPYLWTFTCCNCSLQLFSLFLFSSKSSFLSTFFAHGMLTSVTRLGDFWKFLAKKFLTRVLKMFGDLLRAILKDINF